MRVIKLKKIPALALLTSFSLIAFTLENLLPTIPVPGVRLGLGNIFIMLCLIWFSFPEALTVFVAKCLLGAIFGGIAKMMYVFPAGLISLVISFLFVRFLSDKVGVVAVCALSAVVHNLSVLFIFGLASGANVYYYATFSALLGLVAGVITGLATFYLIKYLPFEISRKKE